MNIRLLLTLVGCLLFTAWVGVRVAHSDFFFPTAQEGRWAYDSPDGFSMDYTIPELGPMATGQVKVNCYHRDVKGVIWSEY